METKGDSNQEEEKKASRNIEQDEENVFETATKEQINKGRLNYETGQYGERLMVCTLYPMRFLLSKSDFKYEVGSGFMYKVIQDKSKFKFFGIILTAAHIFYNPALVYTSCLFGFRINEEEQVDYPVCKVFIPEEFTLAKDLAQKRSHDYGFCVLDMSEGKIPPYEYFGKAGWEFGPKFNPAEEFCKKLSREPERDQKLKMICPFTVDKHDLTKKHPGQEEFEGVFKKTEGPFENKKFITYDIPTVPGHSGAVVGTVENENQFVPLAIHSGIDPESKNKTAQDPLNNSGKTINKEVINLGRYVEAEILRDFEAMSGIKNQLVAVTLEEMTNDAKETKGQIKAVERVIAKGKRFKA